MRTDHILKVVLMATTGAVVLSASAISAPLQTSTGLAAAVPALTEKVWCRYGQCYDNGVGVGGLVGGLIGGAIAAGAATAAAQQEAAAAQQHAASCAQRYRSYDPASNTYVAKGRRYPCQ
ncbi:BA14K family protein [Bradyrhizobium sp. 31Argb]|uniref:BA14K family protein n=1 Tax=unclassified Bradyrhizobium TaxID=2631580 RepID=UPI00102E47E8|nr:MULTISPECIES: BA14K family protein [unclassified Bradyrhizobium]MDI4236989.1 BA14K family protein [Bradyrhizobium sp. Arg237L]TAI67698.1 BA14K family protein [Bradyrhizobium sp. Leo170]